MTKEEMKNRISMALKEPILQQGFEIICRENTELKDKNRHDCPSCPAFGRHCPHKVNGDPYFYDCYLTVKKLEKENTELEAQIEELKKENEELQIENAQLDNDNLVAQEVFEENVKLKARVKWYSEQICNKECAEVWGDLAKAKEIIKELIVYLYSTLGDTFCKDDNYTLFTKAEDFIKKLDK